MNKVLLLDPNELHEHEATDTEQVLVVLQLMRKKGEFHPPLLVDAVTKVVLDGHHRLAASKMLGCTRIPCYCVDYMHDATVTVSSWRHDFRITKQQVIDMGLSGENFPLKTTRHNYKIPDTLEPVPLSELIPGESWAN